MPQTKRKTLTKASASLFQTVLPIFQNANLPEGFLSSFKTGPHAQNDSEFLSNSSARLRFPLSFASSGQSFVSTPQLRFTRRSVIYRCAIHVCIRFLRVPGGFPVSIKCFRKKTPAGRPGPSGSVVELSATRPRVVSCPGHEWMSTPNLPGVESRLVTPVDECGKLFPATTTCKAVLEDMRQSLLLAPTWTLRPEELFLQHQVIIFHSAIAGIAEYF